MMDSILKLFVPIHSEGQKFLLIFAGLTLALLFMLGDIGYVGIILIAWCYYFFRDPARTVPDRDGLVVSPADGEVCLIAQATPPRELDMGESQVTRVSVFMNVFDCHVNRTPIAGTLSRTQYYPGKFLSADLDSASEENERQAYRVDGTDGRSVAFVQIAGFVARRIVKEADDGQELLAGERIGMIRFGSRVDVYLPQGVPSLVAVGQKCVSGETILADCLSDEPARLGVSR
jgi:phosphatidylserine decarboxylase